MKTNIKTTLTKITKLTFFIALAVATGFGITYAGSLTPSSAPAKTMATLGDLYTLVNTGTSTVSTDFATPGSVSATMNSIGSIYDLLASQLAFITPGNLRDGVTAFGVEGTYDTALTWSADDVTIDAVTWFDARDACIALTEGSHTDWRLPTYAELVDASPSGSNPISGFPNTWYWSGSDFSADTNQAWFTDMSNALSGIDPKVSPIHYVRCVR